MNFSELIFSSSPWWVVLAIVVAIAYASILYAKRGPWGELGSKLLFGLRAVTVFLTSLLLINPLLKQTKNTLAKPLAAIIVDNSTSVKESVPEKVMKSSISNVKKLISSLTERGFEVVARDLEKEVTHLDSLLFNATSSNLSKVMHDVENAYKGLNLSFIVLVSDGIYNVGTAPDYLNYSIPLFTAGIGDTIPKKDIILKSVKYNKVAYQGNKFPVHVEILHNGFEGENIVVNLLGDGKVLQSKNVTFPGQMKLTSLDFQVEAKDSGFKRYVVQIPAMDLEQTITNNRRDIYVDIIDNRDKILILGASPHPDIKAIKKVLEKNKNYEINTYFPGIDDYEDKNYSLVIVHQPYAGNRLQDQQLTDLINKKTAVFYLVGAKTNLKNFNKINRLMEIQQIRGQRDKVSPVLNSNFTKFKLDEGNLEDLDDFPPISIPYGNVSLKSEAETLLYQRIGSIESTKPLLVVSGGDDRKEAVLLGTGIWQWRIQEVMKTEESKSFDTWMAKLIQYLNTKEDKSKFRVTNSSDEYTNSEPVIFTVECYNNIYENIYDIPVDIEVINEEGKPAKYSFITSESNSDYKISDLEAGVYRYKASAVVGGQRLLATGGFSVKALQIESINLTADFDMLRRLSAKTGGKFAMVADSGLVANFNQLEAQGLIYSESEYSPLVDLKWLFFVLILLISIEWFVRKYSGGY